MAGKAIPPTVLLPRLHVAVSWKRPQVPPVVIPNHRRREACTPALTALAPAQARISWALPLLLHQNGRTARIPTGWRAWIVHELRKRERPSNVVLLVNIANLMKMFPS